MSARKRIVKKLPEFRMPREKQEEPEEDLKVAKARMLKEIEANEKNKKDWFDKELDKNMKK
jgi:hypothetical protein